MEEKLIESCKKLLNDFAKIPKFEESFISILYYIVIGIIALLKTLDLFLVRNLNKEWL